MLTVNDVPLFRSALPPVYAEVGRAEDAGEKEESAKATKESGAIIAIRWQYALEPDYLQKELGRASASDDHEARCNALTFVDYANGLHNDAIAAYQALHTLGLAFKGGKPTFDFNFTPEKMSNVR